MFLLTAKLKVSTLSHEVQVGDCLARQRISIDVLYNREFKSDEEVNISAEDKGFDVTITTDDHNRDFIFIRLCLIYMLRFARLSMRANLKNENDLT